MSLGKGRTKRSSKHDAFENITHDGSMSCSISDQSTSVDGESYGGSEGQDEHKAIWSLPLGVAIPDQVRVCATADQRGTILKRPSGLCLSVW